jgi:hypothetical protein
MTRKLRLALLTLFCLSCDKQAAHPASTAVNQPAIYSAGQTGRYQLGNYRVTVDTIQRTPNGPKSQTEEHFELLRIDTWTGRVDKYHQTLFVDEQGNLDFKHSDGTWLPMEGLEERSKSEIQDQQKQGT